MKLYVTPEWEQIRLLPDDVLTTSGELSLSDLYQPEGIQVDTITWKNA